MHIGGGSPQGAFSNFFIIEDMKMTQKSKMKDL